MDQMQVFTLGRVLGWLVFSGFLMTALNPFFKEVNKRHMVKRSARDGLRRGYQKFLRGYLKAHPYLGLTTAALMMAHLLIQYSFYGFYLSGFVAGTLMLLLVSLGAFGKFVKKKKPGLWLQAHRLLSLILILVVIVHIAIARLS